MLKEREAVVKTAHLIVDGVVVCAAYLLAIVLRRELGPALSGSWFSPLSQVIPASNVGTGQYAVFMAVAVFLWCWMLYACGMYRSMRVLSYRRILWTICRAGFLTFIAFGATLFLFKATSMSRLFLVLFAGLSSLFIVAEKTAVFLLLHRLRRRGRDYRRILIVGTGRRAADFIRRTRSHREWGLQILGAIDDEPGRADKRVDAADIIGSLEDIPRILHTDAVDEVVFVVPRSRLSHIEDAIHDCETEGVGTVIPVDLFDMKIARAEVSDIDGIPLLRFSTTRISEWQLFVKRLIDIAFSFIVILILLPFLPIAVVLIKASSPGPVFFKQQRLGFHGRKFILYKFRTMRGGAHDVLSKVASMEEMETPEFKNRKMQWITPVGKIMRKLSIDELPQFFNVLIGDMSLIGPRPTVPDEVEKYKAWQRRRFSMKPGLTCLWQVNGRRNIGFEDWMKLDLEYLDNWSLWLDMKILAKTVPVVLFGIGAY